MDYFFQWRRYIDHLPVVLVMGNHDKFPETYYSKEGIEVHRHSLKVKGFEFTHEPAVNSNGLYTFSGHIHPAVRIKGMGKQCVRLPCFYFGTDYAILPAFGNFTGTALINRTDADTVFAITKKEVIRL